MPSTTVLSLAPIDHSGSFVGGSAKAVPVGFASVDITIQCTTGTPATPFTGFAHPFSSPAMSITFGLQWSWDGGVTFNGSTEGTQNGSATGSWGTDRAGNPVMAPDVNLELPFNAALGGSPNTYRPFASIVGGPVTFGITVVENTV